MKIARGEEAGHFRKVAGVSIVAAGGPPCMVTQSGPPPVPPFLLVQNLSSKQIVPTDNMWPNFDDGYSRYS